MHKTGQSEGFLGRLIGLLLKTGLPLMQNVLKPLAKNVLVPLMPLPLTAAVSATDGVMQKKKFGAGSTTAVTSNKEIDDIMKIVKSLEDACLSIKGANETIKNESISKGADFSACY